MTKPNDAVPSTAYSLAKWTEASRATRVSTTYRSTANVPLGENRVLVQGKLLTTAKGSIEISVAVDPGSVARKIAIRQINAEIEGRFSMQDSATMGNSASGS